MLRLDFEDTCRDSCGGAGIAALIFSLVFAYAFLSLLRDLVSLSACSTLGSLMPTLRKLVWLFWRVGSLGVPLLELLSAMPPHLTDARFFKIGLLMALELARSPPLFDCAELDLFALNVILALSCFFWDAFSRSLLLDEDRLPLSCC